MLKKNLYIGLMSGTSMDGIDAALVSFDPKLQLLGTTTINIPAPLKATLVTLCGDDLVTLKSLGEIDVQMGRLFADAVLTLLKKTGVSATDITAIGSHGQTIYHHPHSAHPFTLQIGDPNIIAAHTNITTVADFRRRDMALGGQGAPLVPAFHDYLLSHRTHDHWIVNIGGIANITYLPSDKTKNIRGFDTGPGNTLLDQWCEQTCVCQCAHCIAQFSHEKRIVDLGGHFAQSGKLSATLLTHFLQDPYFKKQPPKSTGREYFNLRWLNEKLMSFQEKLAAEDIQNTLTELTAITIAASITQAHKHTVYVCGGGAFNTYLMQRLQAHCPAVTIQPTTAIGINPQWMEAMAFAWLAKQTIEKKPGNCPHVTGARQETILGGIYFAH